MSFRKQSLLVWATCLFTLPALAQTTPSPAAATPATVAAPGAATAASTQQIPAQTAPAQPAATGVTVHGTITDPDGELIPGATISYTPAHGNGRTVQSGSDGTYSLPLAPGAYTFVVSMKGFSSYSALNVKIPNVNSITVDAKLAVGTTDQVVNVDANSVQLSVDPESNQSATIISGKDLDALSDDPDELTSELQALAGPSAGPNGGQIYVDGFTGGQLPPKSSIREIRINQNPFSAQYDKLGFGRIEVFTKPGTDKLHGNIQVNGNPSQFNSSNPLTSGYQPPYHTFFLFGNLTGPLSKIASYNLGGSFRQIQDDQFTNTVILAPTAGSTTVCPPQSSVACVSSTYQASTYYPQTRGDFNPRLDLALGQKNVLTTRYQFVKNDSTNAGIGNLTLPSAGYDTGTLSNILQMSDTQTYSTHLINETRFEYEREHVSTTPLNSAPFVSVSGIFSYGGYSGQSLTDHQDHYEIQNYTSYQTKDNKNFIRFGGRLRLTREAQDTENNTNGSFIYTGTAGYQANTPAQFDITQVNNHKIGDTYADLGLYLENDWKARQNLTISYGIRYETQNHLPSDHHDFAPRVAVNYGLFNGHGAPKTVLRGGFGIFYDRFAQGNILTLQQENGVNETVYTVKNPGSTCFPGAASTVAGYAAVCGATTSTQTTYAAAASLRSPYIIEFAAGADQQIGRAGTLSVNYIHSQGAHQLATQNIGYNFFAPAISTANYQYFTEGVFNQNQIVLNGHVQTAKWLSLFGYYSLNYANGDTSGAGSFITTPGNIAADYGRTTFSVRNRIFLAGSVTLPKFIQFSPFMIGQSGNPYNVTTGSDNNNDTIFNDRPLLTTLTPNGTTIKSIPGCGTFAQPGTAGAGTTTAPINYCTGPALFTLNFRLTKTFGFGPSTQSAASAQPKGQGSGSHSHGGSGGPGGGGPGGMGMGGGGSSTGKRYNLGIGLQVQNLFDNHDLSTPQGTLSSPYFGQSTQLSGGAYTTNSAVRRISLQTSFSF